ncbi:MAG: hypothetical protein KF829_06470, partial [Ferruginibacter sp.]|nr:hypothetical protein [Ferruginibacter sp.]
ANAGSDITITLPQNATTLNGGGSDGDGYIIGYHWEQVSGPSIAYITSANGSVTSVTGLITGMYIFKLTVTDNSGSTGADQVSVTVLPQPNQAPTANAGSDITITLPQNATTLNGSGSDVDGTVVSYQWEQISGPNSATITNANAAVANVSGLVQGSYVFRITVTDNEGATGNDAVNVQVLTAANLPPVANAGSDITITLPVNTVTLSGSGTDPDNYVVAYRWVKVSGGVANITNSNLAQTTVNGLEAGIYTFELTVTDNSGATGSDQVVVTVLPAANISPMVNAGNDQTITLPVNWVVLNGSAIDGDGTIVAYEWIKVSGGDANIQSPSSSVSQVTNLEEGLYTFRLVVTDNDGASASGEMHVLVLAQPFNNPPIANAGLDQTINLPQNQILLDGGGTDSDGQVVAYEWLKITGPAGGFVTNGNNASTTVTGLQLGVYKFQLIVVDNEGAIGRDTVVITVLPASGNLAPTANAGPDLTVLLPISSVELHGEGSDLDGDVVRYRWNVLSGPNRPALRGSNDSRLYMSYLRQGVYTIEFIVWDNEGAEGRDTMLLYVNQNQVTNDLPDDFIRTFPNPVVNRLTIHFRTYHQNRSIRCVVVDLMGMPVSERIVILSNFVNIFQMNLSHLHTGFYRLNIYSDGYPTVSMPIIKQ